MNENLVKYLLKYQMEDFEAECDKKIEEETKRPHFSFIYNMGAARFNSLAQQEKIYFSCPR